ncbi:MmgE/PrpD family protein [Labrenzia sp. PHM005]|uniref:MmgE/PrpD family protein n=1 Tax=Labrenzia sp. PHM005 TaxID=2590016 RepID=UPI0011409254|nr:MmgE/PrpD family protein [Labrenzia sp. PHM005]QDG77785.1 MmgE/PrpD family protein [Labrenzia sp. PHM005]
MPFIDDLISFSEIAPGEISETALKLAQFSLLDWLVCGRAGAEEPVSQKLREFAAREGGIEAASTFQGQKLPARTAALVNGAASHALDYDDTHFAHVGHLSVGIFPAALAAAEEVDASAADMIAAFAVGTEAAIRIGLVLGARHYNTGFHQTATAGAFGATIAAGRLYGLSQERMRAAIGLCATRASGLKSQFGTMGKPYNAGIAASNGVECAQLAALGLTSCDDGLLGNQGFAETHHAGLPLETAGWDDFAGGKLLFEDNKYKLHACCHGLHAMIEGLLLVRGGGFALSDVAALSLKTNPRWLKVCDIKHPRTGLEVKFSYAWLAGMTLRGDATGAPNLYTDDVAQDPELSALAEKVTVIGENSLTDLQAEGVLTLKSGETRPISFDLAAPLPLAILEKKLKTKAQDCLGSDGGRIWAMLDQLEHMSAREIGALVSG